MKSSLALPAGMVTMVAGSPLLSPLTVELAGVPARVCEGGSVVVIAT